MTHKDYMEGKVTHEQFYTAVAKEAGIGNFRNGFIVEVRAALKSGDIWLNTIPLHVWDRMAEANKPTISRALKKMGTFYSMASGVCTMKQAARNQAEQE